MARINIEDKWWGDPRRMMLNIKLGLGTADGCFLIAVKLSQDHNGEAFDSRHKLLTGWAEALVESGLAEGTPEALYIKGSKEHHEWIKTQRAHGLKGGESTKKKWRQTLGALEGYPLANPTAEPTLSSSSSSSKRKKNTCAKSEIECRFAEVWEAYPRKIAKTEALNRYKRLITSEDDHVKFTLSVKNYVAYCTANKTEEQYIKHMASFLGIETKQTWRDWIEYKSTEPPIEVYTFADLDRLFA